MDQAVKKFKLGHYNIFDNQCIIYYSNPFLLFLSLGEQLSNISLGLTDIFVQNLRTVHNLRLSSVQHFTDLPSHESLSSTRRTVHENTAHVFDAELLDDLGRENTRGEGASKDRVELFVETADAHFGEVPVRVDY